MNNVGYTRTSYSPKNHEHVSTRYSARCISKHTKSETNIQTADPAQSYSMSGILLVHLLFVNLLLVRLWERETWGRGGISLRRHREVGGRSIGHWSRMVHRVVRSIVSVVVCNLGIIVRVQSEFIFGKLCGPLLSPHLSHIPRDNKQTV